MVFRSVKTVPSEQILLIIYGVIILLIAGKNLLCHRQRTLPKALLLVILLLAGVIHGMFVSGGALLVVYAAQVLKREGRIPRNPCTGMGGVKFYTSGITGTAGRFLQREISG